MKMHLLSSSTCRTCMNKEENCLKLEQTYISYENSNIPILDVLNLVSDIEVNKEYYPDVICPKCIDKAIVVYKFKLQCDKSNKLFKDAVKVCNNATSNRLETNSVLASDEITLCGTTNNPVNETHVTNSETLKLKCASKKLQKMKTGEFDNALFCQQCNKTFKTKYILNAHIKRHLYKGHFLCNICGKRFSSQSCLTRHNRVHTGEKNYECQICYKRFPSANNLALHSRIHSGIKPYLCTICGKSFSHPTGLTYHIRTHTKEKPYSCDVCSKSFAIQCHVERHRKTHSGERPFPCKQCDKAFIKKNDLHRHEAVHTGIKPHICNICNKSFLRKMHLNYHMMVHTKERPHICETCGKGFIRRYYLKAHLKRRHGTVENYSTNDT